MASYKRILDNSVAWEYLQAGLLYGMWSFDNDPQPRIVERWKDRDEWMRMRFDGHICMCNYVLVEE